MIKSVRNNPATNQSTACITVGFIVFFSFFLLFGFLLFGQDLIIRFALAPALHVQDQRPKRGDPHNGLYDCLIHFGIRFLSLTCQSSSSTGTTPGKALTSRARPRQSSSTAG
jgi:hypothetical protein